MTFDPIKMTTLRACLTMMLASMCLHMPAQAQTSVKDLAGEYQLLSSTTVPASNWGYAKGRISIRPLDERHVLILIACGWKGVPKEVCGDHMFAQLRDGGFYLQDMNTDLMRLYFDPARRQITVISRAVDAKASVRHDIFGATDAALVDPALVRRVKRQLDSAEHKESVRVFGHYSKRAYMNNRIEFQHR
jgi:hypothetical protein